MSDLPMLAALVIAAVASVLAFYCARGVLLAVEQSRTPPADRRDGYRTTPDWVLRAAAWLFGLFAVLGWLIAVGIFLVVWS